MNTDTPETDAVWSSPDGNILEHAKKLERERTQFKTRLEEALSRTEHQWLLKVASRLVSAGCREEGIEGALDELVAERDQIKARLAMATPCIFEGGQRKELADLKQERDQLKAQLADIRKQLKGHTFSKLDGDNGLAAATMRGFDGYAEQVAQLESDIAELNERAIESVNSYSRTMAELRAENNRLRKHLVRLSSHGHADDCRFLRWADGTCNCGGAAADALLPNPYTPPSNA
jgi:cell division protein FtsB